MKPFASQLRIVVLALGLAACLFAPGGKATAQGNNPQILPPQAKFHGLSYADWEVKWNQEAMAIPAGPDNPFNAGGIFGADRGIRFLTGATGGGTVDVTVPAGTALFFPLITVECSSLEAPPFYGGTEAEQRACVESFKPGFTDLFATIDGRAVQNPGAYWTETPQYAFSVPADNNLGVPGPATGRSVSAGYFLLLAPLSVGTQVIHFGGTYAPFDYSIDVTYVVTVTPR